MALVKKYFEDFSWDFQLIMIVWNLKASRLRLYVYTKKLVGAIFNIDYDSNVESLTVFLIK